MDKQIITFSASEQALTKTGGIDRYASNIVSYVEAHFSLGDNWSGYDSVRAVWFNDFDCIATVLDSLGVCIVPYEVLRRKGNVKVNLVGSISEDDILTDRLTSYPITALVVDANAKPDGDNTTPITPSQFEQFVEVVKADADRAEEASNDAKGYAESAEESAEKAEQASANAGYMFFHIDEDGHLIYERTPNTEVDFYLDNGHLYVGAIA